MWFGLILATLFQQFDQPRIVRLDSGLRIVIVEDRSTPAVSVQLWYRAGSSLDDPANPGLCQIARTLLEHRDGLATTLRAAGGRFESLTLPDAAYFATTLPPELLDKVLTLEAQRMRPIDKSQINVASAVQDAARRPAVSASDQSLRSSSGDMPSALDAILAAAFPKHPYNRPPALVSESLTGLTTDTLADFLNRWFVPGNATLFIIGNVDALPTEDLVRRRFAQLKWREPPRRPEAPRPTKVEVQLEHRSPAPSGIDFAWVTLPWGYFENAAIDTLMHQLCNPVDGPLARRLRLAGLPAPGFARYAWYQHGLLVLSLDVPPDRRREAERIIREALQAAQSELATPAQLNRAVTAATRRVVSNQSTFHQRALQLASHEIVGGDMLLATMESLRYERVAAADLQLRASMLGRLRRIVVRRTAGAPTNSNRMPAPVAARLTGEQGLAFLIAGTSKFAHPAIAERPELARWNSQRLTDRLTVAFRSIPAAQSAIVRTTLDVLLDRPLPAVQALMQGSAACDAGCLRDYLSYHGIEMIPFSDGRRHGLIASGPPSRIPQMIEWQAKLLQKPNRSEPALEAALASTRAERSRLMADPSALADYLANQALASCPPRLPPVDISADELQEMLVRLKSSPHAQVDVAGNFDRRQIIGELRRFWPDSGPKQVLEPTKPTIEPNQHSVTIFWRPEPAPGVHLRVIVRGVKTADPRADIDTVCRLIGPPIDQMANIDARHCWLWQSRAIDTSTLLASTTTSTAVAEHLSAILRRLQAIREGSVPPSQLRLALNLARAAQFTVEPRGLPTFDTSAPPSNADWRITIIIVGGDESLAPKLTTLGRLQRLDAR